MIQKTRQDKEGVVANESATLNLGPNEIGRARRDAYDKAVRKEGLRSLNEWAKKHLDKAAGFTPPAK